MDKRDAFTVIEGGLAAPAAAAVSVVQSKVITAKAVADPEQLARLLTEMRAELDRVRKQSNTPFTGGVLVRAVSLAVGVNLIAHKLGRNPRDVFVTVCTVASAITLATTPAGVDPTQFVALNATVATVGSVLVT